MKIKNSVFNISDVFACLAEALATPASVFSSLSHDPAAIDLNYATTYAKLIHVMFSGYEFRTTSLAGAKVFGAMCFEVAPFPVSAGEAHAIVKTHSWRLELDV